MRPNLRPMKILLLVITVFTVGACSNNAVDTQTKQATEKGVTIGQVQSIETGTIVGVNTYIIRPERIRSYGNVGVGIGSGGYRGIYGSVDVGTLARLFRNATGPKKAYEIIVKTTKGETVAITQLQNDNFRAGDRVKILLRNGEARVIR